MKFDRFPLIITTLAIASNPGVLALAHGLRRMQETEDKPEDVGRDNPERWLHDYASKGDQVAGSLKFVLDTDSIPIGKATTLVTDHQNVFVWHKSFGNAIRTNSARLDFALRKDNMDYKFTAHRSKDFMKESVGNFGEESGRFAWEGTIMSDGTSGGEVTCSFGWGNLDCTIYVSDVAFDSIYEVVMEEKNLYLMKTLKSDIEQEGEDDTPDTGIKIRAKPPSNSTIIYQAESQIENEMTVYEMGDQEDSSLRRNMKFTHKYGGATDVIVFYTSDAASHYGSSSSLENKIEQLVAQWNAAHDEGGVTDAKKYLNLVATWQLFSSDSSNWSNWAGNAISTAVRDAFGDNSVLNSRRNLVGADVMVMIHPWDGGNINGQSNFNGYENVVRVGALSGVTFQHEIAHTFNVRHCHGDVYSQNGNWIATTMAYARSGNTRINQWSGETANFFNNEVGIKYSEVGPDSSSCNGPPGEHCCTNNGSLNLRKAWDFKESKGAIRVNPGTIGNQKQWSWRSCYAGFDAIGLDIYEQWGSFERIVIRATCGGTTYNIGSTGYNKQYSHMLSCSNGVKPGGLVLYEYRDGTKDRYRLGIYCPGQGWKYTPRPNGSFVAYDWSAYWKTANPSKRKLSYIKWNRYQTWQLDTYNMDIFFS